MPQTSWFGLKSLYSPAVFIPQKGTPSAGLSSEFTLILLQIVKGFYQMELYEYVCILTKLPPRPGSPWTELCSNSKWLPLTFAYHRIMHGPRTHSQINPATIPVIIPTQGGLDSQMVYLSLKYKTRDIDWDLYMIHYSFHPNVAMYMHICIVWATVVKSCFAEQMVRILWRFIATEFQWWYVPPASDVFSRIPKTWTGHKLWPGALPVGTEGNHRLRFDRMECLQTVRFAADLDSVLKLTK